MESKLIECTSCAGQLAKSAESCPKCGAINNFIHPKFKEFIEHATEFKVEGFTYHFLRTRLWGETKSTQLKLMGVSVGICALALLLFFVSASLGVTVLMIGTILTALATLTKDKGKTFSVDYSNGEPEWMSSDDVFWAEIKKFFLSQEVFNK